MYSFNTHGSLILKKHNYLLIYDRLFSYSIKINV